MPTVVSPRKPTKRRGPFRRRIIAACEANLTSIMARQKFKYFNRRCSHGSSSGPIRGPSGDRMDPSAYADGSIKSGRVEGKSPRTNPGSVCPANWKHAAKLTGPNMIEEKAARSREGRGVRARGVKTGGEAGGIESEQAIGWP